MVGYIFSILASSLIISKYLESITGCKTISSMSCTYASFSSKLFWAFVSTLTGLLFEFCDSELYLLKPLFLPTMPSSQEKLLDIFERCKVLDRLLDFKNFFYRCFWNSHISSNKASRYISASWAMTSFSNYSHGSFRIDNEFANDNKGCSSIAEATLSPTFTEFLYTFSAWNVCVKLCKSGRFWY